MLSDNQMLQRRNRELSILNTIAEAMNREIDLRQALRTALAQVAGLLDLQTAWIWLLDEDNGSPYLAEAQNLPPALKDHPERLTGSCYCLDTFRAGDMRGAANVNVVTCSRLKWLDSSGTKGLRYHASIPLYAHGKKMGVMNVASPDWRELSADDLRILYTVGDMLGIAIERARLFARSADIGAAQERNRIAREIHDTLAQGLTAIALQLETADALLDSAPEAARAQRSVQQALELARANLDEARRSVMDLRAAPLEGRSLPQALGELVQQYSDREHISASLEVSGETRPISARMEMALYRTAQEALSNVARHAHAENVLLELNYGLDDIQLVIRDNGSGFDPAAISAGRFGLIGLNERAHLLNGMLEIWSAPGEGTRIVMTLPLEHRLNE